MSKLWVLLSLLLFLVGCSHQISNTTEFTVKYKNNSFRVIVEKPVVTKDKYPLIIYNHGGGYRTFEPFQLDKVAKELSKAGFVVWVPVRSLWTPERAMINYEEARSVSRKLLERALNTDYINKSNINIVGFCLGAWATLTEHINDPVHSITLIGFGAPFDDTLLYDMVYSMVDKDKLTSLKPNVLVMVSQGDTKVATEPAKILCDNLKALGKQVACIEYSKGDHISLAGNRSYINDLKSYLLGLPLNTSDNIKTNKMLLEKWNEVRKSGYW